MTMSVQTALVMTVLGPDRPGIVDRVSSVIAQHDGNWLESRMARLGGFFAGILRIELPAEKLQALEAALAALQAQGLDVVVHRDTSPASGGAGASAGRMRLLEVVGHDRPGIVRQLSGALAAHGVNVESFESECASAPMSGEPLFQARARLSIPAQCSIDELKARLEAIAADLIVEVSLQDEPAGTDRNPRTA